MSEEDIITAFRMSGLKPNWGIYYVFEGRKIHEFLITNTGDFANFKFGVTDATVEQIEDIINTNWFVGSWEERKPNIPKFLGEVRKRNNKISPKIIRGTYGSNRIFKT